MRSIYSDLTVTPDNISPGCFLVRRGQSLVRLCPSLPPMRDYYTAHFLEGNPPAQFSGKSEAGVYVGVPWETKDAMVALLQEVWAK